MDLMPKQASFNEVTELASNTYANNESRDSSTPCSGTKENYGMPVGLCCSSLDYDYYNNEDLNLYNGKGIFLNSKDIFEMISENIASKRQIRTAESEDSLSSIEDLFSGNSSPDNMFIDYRQRDGSLASKMSRRDQTEFLLPDNSLRPTLFINMSFNDREDTASQESATPSSIYDDESIGMSGYYDDDEDKERFCQQEEIITKRIKLEAESLKVEDDISISSLSFTDEARETPTSKIVFIELEPIENTFLSEASSADTQSQGPLNEHDLLIQVQKFFSENPMIDITTCRNQVITSKYFTDEFLQQHGQTVDENEVVSVGMELEDNTETEIGSHKSYSYLKNEFLQQHERTVDENEVISVKVELGNNTVTEMESHDSASYLKRFGKLLERRPLSVLTTLLKFYLSSYNMYTY